MKKSMVKIFASLMMTTLVFLSAIFAVGCNNGGGNNSTQKPSNLTAESAVYELKGPMIDGRAATAEEKEQYNLQEPMYCFVRVDFNTNELTFYYMFFYVNEGPVETHMDVSVLGGENSVYTLTTNKGTAQFNSSTNTIIVLEDISGDMAVIRNVEWTFEYFEALDYDLDQTIEDRMDAFYDTLS